jgi:hypothetical protein
VSGVHEKPVGETVEWYTPPALFEALDIKFDLDPAAPAYPAADWIPATLRYTQDGEKLPWYGRVWLNPPYGPALVPFVNRMLGHGNGLMLLAARTETRAFQRAAKTADAVCFLRERLHFIRPDGVQSRASFASILFAYSAECAAALKRADLGWTP